MSSAVGSGSCRIPTPTANCSTGARYCSRPITLSGSRRVPAANSSSGTTVMTPARGEQHRGRPAGAEHQSPWAPMTAMRDQRRDELHAGLDRQRVDRADVGLLLAEAVHAEREREDQRDPRRPAVVDRDHDDRDRADPDRDPLRPAQPLAEHDHAEHDREQRVDEVAQAGLDDVAGVHAADVGAPVDRDEHRARRSSSPSARRSAHRGAHAGEPAGERSSTSTMTSDQAIREARISTVPAGSSSGK